MSSSSVRRESTAPLVLAAGLTSSRRLARNVIWNLVGEAAPFAIAFFAIPILIHTLGVARFGVLTIAWSLLTYFGIFDMGLGRAMTKLIADELAAGRTREVPGLFWTGMTLMIAVGCVAGGVAALLLPWGARHFLNVPAGLRTDTIAAFYELALAFPLIVSSAGLRGTLAASQRFDLINLVELPTGALIFLAPLMVLPYSHSLFAVVAALIATRVLYWGIAFALCLKTLPAALEMVTPRKKHMRALLSFGGWVMVSNLVGPLMVFTDRFLIAAMISLAAVAYYTTPFEVIFRLSIIPAAITAVLFPAFAESFVLDVRRAATLFDKGTKVILAAMFPMLLIAAGFAHQGFLWWLGPGFADKSTPVIQWLSLGMLINAASFVGFALIQALNRPDITAKLHLIELPIYLAALAGLIRLYGIKGAAIAWTLRVLADSTVILWIAVRLSPAIARHARDAAVITGFGCAAIVAMMVMPENITLRAVFAAVCLAVAARTLASELNFLAFFWRDGGIGPAAVDR